MTKIRYWPPILMLATTVACGDGTSSSDAGVVAQDGAKSHRPDTRPDSVSPDLSLADTLSSRRHYCAGNGPPVIISNPATGETVCTGALAQVAFRYALCSCDPIDSVGGIRTDGFDSTSGAYDPAKPGSGAGLGVNGPFQAVGASSIGGPMRVGSGGATFSSETPIKGTFACEGDVDHTGNLNISGDAMVNGNIHGVGLLRIGGTLTQPRGKRLASSSQNVAKKERRQVNIAPPCDCSAQHMIDIPRLVGIHRQAHDNAEVGLATDTLADYKSETVVDIPCGRFFLDKISGIGALTLEVSGRAALFVAGDVAMTGPLKVRLLSDAAELDLFIQGNLQAIGGLDLGAVSAPKKVRLYIGGSEMVELVGGNVLGGNLYAPRATVRAVGPLEVYGSIFAKSIRSVGGVTVHYDRGILRAGKGCSKAAKPARCADCRDCGNQACVGGQCGRCTDDNDCCAPLRCLQGRCELRVY